MPTSHDPDTHAIVTFDVCLGFSSQGQRLRRVDVGAVGRFAIDQTMQQVQHMRFGWHALIQSQLHSSDDNLFVVMKHQSEDIGHLTIATGTAKHLVLQLSKGQRQFHEGSTIAQGTRLALDNGKAMPASPLRQLERDDPVTRYDLVEMHPRQNTS